jgi:3-methyladenine DNA glycosylase AlkC
MEKISTARKGARRRSEVPAQVIQWLNQGKTPSVNLVEWMVVDQEKLLRSVFPILGLTKYLANAIEKLRTAPKRSSLTDIKIIGKSLQQQISSEKEFQRVYGILNSNVSDLIRSYACFVLAYSPAYKLDEKLKLAWPLVTDIHFGVREAIWLALREEVAAQLELAIPLLAEWSRNADENIRRFASEITRPRGVWCKHIDRLKKQPEMALPILEPLKADPAKYVQDSVGNWLNDASKTRPDFVLSVCANWNKGSENKATERIMQKALRTINKQ